MINLRCAPWSNPSASIRFLKISAILELHLSGYSSALLLLALPPSQLACIHLSLTAVSDTIEAVAPRSSRLEPSLLPLLFKLLLKPTVFGKGRRCVLK